MTGRATSAADPVTTARGKAWLEAEVRGGHYRGADDVAAEVDGMTLRADLDLSETRHVTFDVDVPTKVNKEQKAALEALATAFPGNPREHLGV